MATLTDLPQDPPPKRRGRPPGSPNRKTTTTAGNRGKISARTAAGKIMSKPEMMAKVKGELYMLVAAGYAIWDMKDPTCAEVMQIPMPDGRDRIEAIVDHMVAIIGRNAGVLAFLSKTGVMMDAGMLFTALMPIAKQWWVHHGPNGVGHGEPAEVANGYAATYPAYAGAGRP
jgi:hypothetical protein